MNALQVQNQSIPQIKMWNNQRVVTFKDIDTVHERPSGTARKRFNENKKHFIDGVDFIVRKTDEARNEYGISAPNGLTLLTESGYLMVVKSFTDDLSWEVQRRLVNGYFKAQEQEQKKQLEWGAPPWEIGTTAKQWPTPPERIWYTANKQRINHICKTMEISHKMFFHRLLMELANWFNIKERKEVYKAAYGIYPAYNMDLLDEFEDMEDVAENYLEFLENSLHNYRHR